MLSWLDDDSFLVFICFARYVSIVGLSIFLCSISIYQLALGLTLTLRVTPDDFDAYVPSRTDVAAYQQE